MGYSIQKHDANSELQIQGKVHEGQDPLQVPSSDQTTRHRDKVVHSNLWHDYQYRKIISIYLNPNAAEHRVFSSFRHWGRCNIIHLYELRVYIYQKKWWHELRLGTCGSGLIGKGIHVVHTACHGYRPIFQFSFSSLLQQHMQSKHLIMRRRQLKVHMLPHFCAHLFAKSFR